MKPLTDPKKTGRIIGIIYHIRKRGLFIPSRVIQVMRRVFLMKKRILVIAEVIATAGLFVSAGYAISTGAQEQSIHDLSREIIQSYGAYGKEPGGKVETLLEEMETLDPQECALWDEITDYWDYVNEEMPVYDEQLPEDLPQGDNLCVIVLGFELNADGSMQDELLERLRVALDCAEQYPNAYVLCTGGGTALYNDQVTEAGLMGEWLLEHGLSKDRLILEDQSCTTAQNALFSYDILLRDYPQVDSVVLVSSHYHIPWGALLFEAAFRKTAAEQGTPEIHVISNCACPVENEAYSDVVRFQTGGMLQLIEEDALAMEYYQGAFIFPE